MNRFPFMKGFTWGYPGVRGDFCHPDALASMKRLRNVGCDWVCIAFSGHYPVGKGPDSTVEEMKASWEPVVASLEASSQRWRKDIFFAECGMMSTRGNSFDYPARWDVGGRPYDGQEQARYYEAAQRAFWDEPWFKGFFWWKWDAVLSRPEASSRNTAKEVVVGQQGFRIVDKPAETVVRQWYAKAR